jgi:hypothetical protein
MRHWSKACHETMPLTLYGYLEIYREKSSNPNTDNVASLEREQLLQFFGRVP